MKTRQLTAILLSALFSAAAFVSCQPTPDEPIVNAGDDSVLNDKIEATALPTPEDGSIYLSSIYGFPSAYTDEFTCVDDDVHFNVDMKIVVPDVQSAPVVEICPSVIAADTVRASPKKCTPALPSMTKRTC